MKMMQARLVLLLFFSWGLGAQPDQEFLAQLYRESDWRLVSESGTGQKVFNKKFDGYGVPAIMVKQKAQVSFEFMIATVEDVGSYGSFLHGVYLKRSDLLHKTGNVIDGYQYVDAPFISDRHYVYRMVKKVNSSAGSIRFDWTLVPRESEYEGFLDSMDIVYSHPIYLKQNVGGWEIIDLSNGMIEVSYRLFADPGGWVPDLLVARANRATAPKMLQGMIDEAIRREKK